MLPSLLRKYTTNSNEAKQAADFVANFVYEDGVPAWVIYDEGRVVFDVNYMY